MFTSKSMREELQKYTQEEIVELFQSVKKFRLEGDKDLKLQIMAADFYGTADGYNIDAICDNICWVLANRYVELIADSKPEPTEVW